MSQFNNSVVPSSQEIPQSTNTVKAGEEAESFDSVATSHSSNDGLITHATQPSKAFSPQKVQQLQRLVGNQGTQKLLRQGRLVADPASTRNSVLQRFAPGPYDNATINSELKGQGKLLEKGWDNEKIDELVAWSNSMNQFRSIIENTFYSDWEYIKEQFASGADLPVKIAAIWRKYQEAHTGEGVLPKGFVGYKGTSGTTWNKGNNSKDWSGCYIGKDLEQAEGYVREQGEGVSIATVWRCTVKKELNIVEVKGKYIASAKIESEDKAKTLKNVLAMDQNKPLIPQLGKAKKGYVGPETGESEEIVIPWDLVPEYLTVEKFKEYKIKNFEIVGWKEPTQTEWQPR